MMKRGEPGKEAHDMAKTSSGLGPTARDQIAATLKEEFGEMWGTFSERVQRSLISGELHRQYNRAYHKRRQAATTKLLQTLKAQGISVEEFLAGKVPAGK
jgi:hypothetical protein